VAAGVIRGGLVVSRHTQSGECGVRTETRSAGGVVSPALRGPRVRGLRQRSTHGAAVGREAHGEARANQRKPKAKRQCHACRRAGTPGLSRPCSNLHGSARGQTARGKPDLALPRGTWPSYFAGAPRDPTTLSLTDSAFTDSDRPRCALCAMSMWL
jgi:hypothetical protein